MLLGRATEFGPEPFLRPLRLFLATFAVRGLTSPGPPQSLNRNGGEGCKLTVRSKAAWYTLRVVPLATSAEGRTDLPA